MEQTDNNLKLSFVRTIGKVFWLMFLNTIWIYKYIDSIQVLYSDFVCAMMYCWHNVWVKLIEDQNQIMITLSVAVYLACTCRLKRACFMHEINVCEELRSVSSFGDLTSRIILLWCGVIFPCVSLMLIKIFIFKLTHISHFSPCYCETVKRYSG